MKVCYLGNFSPEFSTENDVARALRSHGVEVVPLQENVPQIWEHLPALTEDCDFLLFTHTWSFDIPIAGVALDAVRAKGTKVIGYHLDRVWGLEREIEITRHPFYTHVDLLVTADGGHEQEWANAGIEHRWLPPAISSRSCYLADADRNTFPHPVVFVGSWKAYHPEWPWRFKMVGELRKRFKRSGDLGLYPMGAQALRGHELNVLYATADVVVGDSCLVGGSSRYWSDRVPETLGRGGILVHPAVVELPAVYGALWEYDRENVEDLFGAIDFARGMDPDVRRAAREQAIEWAVDGNTYEDRMVDLLKSVDDLGVRRRARSFGVTAQFEPREGSTDQIVIDETWGENVYRLDPSWVVDGVVIDIGANIGSVTLWAAMLGAAHVYAVEPSRANVHELENNLKLNRIMDSMVTVIPMAVHGFDADADLDWARLEGEGGATKVREWSRVASDMDVVPAISFAELFHEPVDEVALLKIDIEGGEWEILTYEENVALIGERVRRMVVEFHDFGVKFDGVRGVEAAFGRVVTMLAEVGKVEILGRPSTGGTIWWEAYR